MNVQLSLSGKQQTSLKKGRAVRISEKNLGAANAVNLVVSQETYNRLSRVSQSKGMDLTLSPSELHATMSGGAVNRRNKADRWTDYLGSTYKSVGTAKSNRSLSRSRRRSAAV